MIHRATDDVGTGKDHPPGSISEKICHSQLQHQDTEGDIGSTRLRRKQLLDLWMFREYELSPSSMGFIGLTPAE